MNQQLVKKLVISMTSLLSLGVVSTVTALPGQPQSAQKVVAISFHSAVKKAQHFAKLEQPKKALEWFEKAFQLANNNPVYKRVALFGMAKMQVWLEQYSTALNTYKKLKTTDLDKMDRAKVNAAIAKLKAIVSPVRAKKRPIRKRYSQNARFQSIAHVRQLILADNAAGALSTLSRFHNKDQFGYYFYLGKAYAMQDQPRKAMKYYRQALTKVNNNGDRIATLIAIGNIEIWLERYPDAEVTFKKALAFRLSSQDHEAALNGLIRAYSHQDYPRKALALLPKNFKMTQPMTLVATAQAANWAGLHYIAKSLFHKSCKLLKKITPSSPLARTAKEEHWIADWGNAKNSVSSDNYFESDTDGFNINRYNVIVTHRFKPTSATQVFLNFANFNNAMTRLNAQTIGVSHSWFATENWHFQLQAALASVGSWSPFLWFAQARYTPNDYITIALYNRQEYVEAFPALFNKITLNSTELSIFTHPFFRFFLGGSVFHHYFSDKNNRNGFVARAIWVLSTHLGLATELRYRYYTNSRPNSINYFSPSSLQDYQAILRIRRRISDVWRVYAQGGIGSQRIANTGSSGIDSFEVGLRGIIRNHLYIRAYYGETNAAMNSANGFGRQYGGFTLTYYTG